MSMTTPSDWPEWPTINVTEATGDCYEIDKGEQVWFVLEDLAAEICFHDGRTPDNLWLPRNDGTWPTSIMRALAQRVEVMKDEHARNNGGRGREEWRQDT